MKRIFFFFLLMSAMAACKNEPKATATGDETSVTQTRPITPPEGGPIVGPKKPPSMQTEMLIGFLTTDYWYIEAYVKINDRDSALENRGRWYRFAPDGTFVSGKYKKQDAKGIWTFDPQTALIYVDSENDAQDGEWKIQMGKSGSVMIWIGTERFLQNSIQIKLENYLELMAELPSPSH
ncbi:MAG: hypothetical protein IPL49_21325 [Saprospirales bacterium]|nr:hypothetical protein [Saprospirales bacterium]